MERSAIRGFRRVNDVLTRYGTTTPSVVPSNARHSTRHCAAASSARVCT